MKERLEFILKNKGLTATSFARMLEIQPSGLSHILSGRNKPSFDLVVKILKVFPEFNPDWLLLGSEQIYRDGAPSSSPTLSFGENSSPMSQASMLDEVRNNELSAAENSTKNELPPIFTSPKNSGKKVERVIILYSNRSFESYSEF